MIYPGRTVWKGVFESDSPVSRRNVTESLFVCTPTFTDRREVCTHSAVESVAQLLEEIAAR